MVRKRRQFIQFGFDPGESAHHFVVIIPEEEGTSVIIEERFQWNEGGQEAPAKAAAIKVKLEPYRWSRIAEGARGQFNQRIRAGGHRSVAWKRGKENLLAPHFGKELTLLAWAVEDIDEGFIPNVIANWTGLEPEERWWLYTTVNATFTKPEVGKDRGWRKAIKIAFSENPVPEVSPERFVEEPDAPLPQKEDAPVIEKVLPGPSLRRKRARKQPAGQGSLFDPL
jgi:hypothetical protein